MKTIPGIVVGALVLVGATALVTSLILHALISCDALPVYDKLDHGFYGLVIKEQTVTGSQSDQLKTYLGTLKKPENEGRVAFCFAFTPKPGSGETPWQDGFPDPQKNCPIEGSPTSGQWEPNPSMSVLSHKIYSVSACDIENVIKAIK